MARTIRAGLADRGQRITNAESLELIARACGADVAALKAALRGGLDALLAAREPLAPGEPEPAADFHRVVQRAVVHMQSAGHEWVTGANLLVAIFSERESHAASFLRDQGVERRDAVDFIVHGTRKEGSAASV